MRYLVLYCSFLIAQMSCTQEKTYDCDELDFENGIYRIHTTQIPATGKMICKNNDGKIVLEEEFLNGLIHGRKIEWDNNGNKISEQNFRYGQSYGKQTIYYEDGKIMSISFFKFDREDSITAEYYLNGRLKSMGRYKFTDSDLYLVKKSQSDSALILDSVGNIIGTKKMAWEYYKPKSGIWKYWDEKGNFIKQELYKDGELVK